MKIEMVCTKGLNNMPIRKTFKNQGALETWLSKNSDSIENVRIREIE